MNVKPGTPENHPFTFPGEAEQVPGATAGDVILHVTSEKHPVFEREGDDLVMERNITLIEALLGFEATIPHLDGRNLRVVRSEVASCDNGVFYGSDDMSVPS